MTDTLNDVSKEHGKFVRALCKERGLQMSKNSIVAGLEARYASLRTHADRCTVARDNAIKAGNWKAAASYAQARKQAFASAMKIGARIDAYKK